MSSYTMSKNKIFLSIAAFCDPMLLFTVRSAFAKARFPDRISFGVVDQSHASVETEITHIGSEASYLHIDPRHSRGACWARALAMTLYAGEEYFLQIDSHTCFDRNWDVTLVDTIETISQRSGNDKVIVSTRPFAFEIDDDGRIRKHRFSATTLKLVPKTNTIRLDDPVVYFSCHDSKKMQDLPGFQVSAAFLFARGRLVEEIPYDPYMYFHGEEQNISIRAFTHGWDIWHPNRLPLCHLYKKRVAGEAPLHWDNEFDISRSMKSEVLRENSSKRLSNLLKGEIGGVYGTGRNRSLDLYLSYSGFEIV